MGRAKKPETQTVRVHKEVKYLIELCAAADGAGGDVPGWLSRLLLPILQGKAAHIHDRVLPHLPKKGKPHA
jgi:hypothetical protein